MFNTECWMIFLSHFSLSTHVLDITAFHILLVFIFDLVDYWRFQLLMQDFLMHSVCFSNLSLSLVILIESPLVENLHSLYILDGSHLVPIILVATEHIKMNFLSKTSILELHCLEDNLDLLASQYLLIIHSCY